MSSKKAKKHTSASPPVLTQLAIDKLRFSFEFYDTSSNEFCLSRWTQEQIRLTLTRLLEISSKTFHELSREKKVLHFHEVIWERTIKTSGFPNKEANKLHAFQFALLGVNGQLARVFGAYAENVFYIVWFDLNHEIWPTA